MHNNKVIALKRMPDHAQNSRKTVGRPWKPGQSGNPGGRPKTAKLAEEIRKFLGEKVGGKDRLRLILEHLRKRKPEVLLHYAFGKPTESAEIASNSTIAGLPEDMLARARKYARSAF